MPFFTYANNHLIDLKAAIMQRNQQNPRNAE
jgi:hypothetical protein